jgi:hypothetical protein
MSGNGIMYPLQDRRKFGRRDNCSEGWIRVRGKPRILCKVRNQTPAGAFLDCAEPRLLPFHFELILDGANEALYCEIRHTLSSGVGVFFIAQEKASTGGEQGRLPTVITESDAWTGGKANKLLRRTVSR